MYPIFKDQAIHSVVASDLRNLLVTGGDTQSKKAPAPVPPPIQLDTKHKVLVSLLRVQLSSSVADVIESLQLLKQILNGQSADALEA